MKLLICGILCLAIAACNSDKGTTTGNPVVSEDDSASGAAAQAVGGALSGSSSSGTHDFTKASQSLSAGTCPEWSTTSSECTASSHTMWLDYDSCNFTKSGTTWSGTQAIIMSSGAAACGTFPNPGANGNLIRQFVHGPGVTTPWAAAITSRYSTVGFIDDKTANLSNFNGDTLATIVNGGYGDKTEFGASGERTGLTIAHRIYIVGSYDHSLYGSLSISETAGAATRTISGTIDVYHNKLKVIGQSTFNNVVHSDTCCLPISGSITTLFNQGTAPPDSALGQAAVGKSETLTFTGCGTADLTSYDGSTRSVALSRCY